MSVEKKKISRRGFIGAIAGVAIAVGAGGYAAGILSGPPAGTQPGAVVTVTAPAATVTQTVGAPNGKTRIRLGAGNPETGPFARDGEDSIRSQNYALEEQQRVWGGILGREVDYINIDVPNKTTEEASAAIRRLITRENVDAIVTDWITLDASEYEESKKHDTYYIHEDTTGLAEKKVLEGGWNSFTDDDTLETWQPGTYWQSFQWDPPEYNYSKGLRFWMKTLEERGLWKPINNKMAWITGDNPYSFRIGKINKELMIQEGWVPTMDETVVVGTVEWGPILDKIRRDPPAFIFNTDLVPRDIATFIIQFQENPTKSIVFGQYGPSIPEFLDIAKEKAIGMAWQTDIGNIRDERTITWENTWQKRWGEFPGYSGAAILYDYTYEWANLVALAGDPTAHLRMSAISNSMVTFWKSHFVYRGVCGTNALKPGQVLRSLPNDVADPAMAVPHNFWQIWDGDPVYNTPGPSQVLIGQYGPPIEYSAFEAFPKDKLAESMGEAAGFGFISGRAPIGGQGIVWDWVSSAHLNDGTGGHTGEFQTPPWFEDARG